MALKSCLRLLFLLTCLGYSSAQVKLTCSSANYTRGSGYGEILMDLATTLSNASSLSMYQNATSRSNSTGQAAYGMFQCRGDVSQDDCWLCVDRTLQIVMEVRCNTSMGANIQQDFCHVRYDNRSYLFDGTMPDTEYWFRIMNGAQSSDLVFQADVKTALLNVTGSAPSNPNYYAFMQQGSVYALAQCDGYLSKNQCRSCLFAGTDFTMFGQSVGGQIHYSSCFYRYEAYAFYKLPSPDPNPPALAPSPSPSPSPSSSRSPSVSDPSESASSFPIGAVIGASVGAAVLLVLCFLFYCIRKKSQLPIQRILSGFGRHVLGDPVIHFSYEELKAATQDFHLDNRIGAGGFGPVYKGTLANGLEVAIKKLSANSSQGKREFMNEVTVITSVQHKNLIKLHGCCVEGSERLLVYEYLPNKSLDNFIFDDTLEDSNAVTLDWNCRMNIILGTARGLSYLHEDSQVRIIHRDIKATNILLDEGLAPKIADFGLAKLFSDDATHVTTRVAGTLGYLSPEYALLGQLTEKADVYSFGVLALEIVSGRRNADFQQPAERQRLVEWAWKCYLEGSQLQLLDPKLQTTSPNTPAEEVIRVIHVALLCLQSSSSNRPSMTKVVQLLAGQSHILEVPKMPRFVFSNDLDAPRFETNASIDSHGGLTTDLLPNNPSLNLGSQILYSTITTR